MRTLITEDLEAISQFDPSMWELLRDKKIFATGCTGFIGSWIIRSFCYLNTKYSLRAELHLLTRNISSFRIKNNELRNNPALKFTEGDIKTFSIPSEKFDYIIHGATEVATFQAGDRSNELLDVGFFGTKRIIELAKSSRSKKVLFLSSGAVYGTQPLDMNSIYETYSGSPLTNTHKSTYGEAKRVGEMLLFNETAFETSSARIFAAAGPFLPIKSHFAFSNFLESCLQNKPIEISGNGKTTRSYLYASDLTLWLWILLLKGKDKEFYNVGSDFEISIHELANLMKQTLNKNIAINVLGTNPDYGRYIPSNDKIRNAFGLKTMVSLKKSIQKSYKYLEATYGF